MFKKEPQDVANNKTVKNYWRKVVHDSCSDSQKGFPDREVVGEINLFLYIVIPQPQILY